MLTAQAKLLSRSILFFGGGRFCFLPKKRAAANACFSLSAAEEEVSAGFIKMT